MTYQRTLRVETEATSANTFPMTLATEGEASDGHILSISGGTIPKQMPLLVSHLNDPTQAAGSIIQAQKDLKAKPRALKATGVVELGGEGISADQRRDLMHMIEAGHIGAVSIRWDAEPGDMIPRTELPKDHPHHVNRESEPEGSPRRYGMYFKKWRALEGSIVAVGADPSALIGRADALEAEGASEERVAFCRALAAEAVPVDPEEPAEVDAEPIELAEAEPEPERDDSQDTTGTVSTTIWRDQEIIEPERAKPDPDPEPEEDKSELRTTVREMLRGGVNADDLIALAEEIAESERTLEEKLARLEQENTALKAELVEARDPGRVSNGDPSPPPAWMDSVPSILAHFRSELQQQRVESLRVVQTMIDEARGRVEPPPMSVREELEAALLGRLNRHEQGHEPDGPVDAGEGAAG